MALFQWFSDEEDGGQTGCIPIDTNSNVALTLVSGDGDSVQMYFVEK